MNSQTNMSQPRDGMTTALMVRGVSAGLVTLLALAGSSVSAALPPVPVPPGNPITENKRVLGKILFWDEQLSTGNTMSCGSCHVPNRAGGDAREGRHPGVDGVLNTADDILGSPGVINSNAEKDYVRDAIFGVNAQVTNRTAMPVINAVYSPTNFWDGRATGTFRDPLTNAVILNNGGALESQAVGPPLSDIEMAHDNVNWAEVTEKLSRSMPLNLANGIPSDVATALADRPSYPDLFLRAFGDRQITPARIALAIATYERTLISDQSPFDRFVAGETTAMTQAQIQGMNVFNSPGAACNVCHTAFQGPPAPPNTVGTGIFSNFTFRNIGLRPPAEDLGRQLVTNNPADRGRFKVPSLRNAGLKRNFMHNGQFNNLTDVIRFYARLPGAAPRFTDNLDPVVANINLPPSPPPPAPTSAAALQDFIQNALTDPRVASQTFPFDKPTLFAERPGDRPTSLGGGVTGSGNILPVMIAVSPPMIGNLEFRVGLFNALGSSAAQLAISDQPPVNGRINPSFFASLNTTTGLGAGNGMATAHWALNPRQWKPGQTIYMQWFVVDPVAPLGQARSNVVSATLFCGSAGCFTAPCNPADIAADNGIPLPPFGNGRENSGVNEGDYNAFFAADGFFAGGINCDIAADDGTPLTAATTFVNNNSGVNEGDYNCFFNAFFTSCQ
ncbi:MAG: hypothetical protein IBJ18_01805 [Phycisphaerales bacterium]|nr:hypothetical protein [Phycisphaerales bacterium]